MPRIRPRRLFVLPLAVLAGLSLVPQASTVHAAPSPSSITIGVDGAAPGSATFSGGPITGSADESGSAAPITCASPTCESIAITVAAPSSLPAKQITLSATVTFAPTANPDGLGGLDLWLLDGSGNVLTSAVSGSSPATVTALGASAGSYTLEVTGENAAVNETYAGSATAAIPAPLSVNPPVAADPAFVTGPLPPAPASGLTGTNEDGEPGIGVDGDGTFWVASDIAPYAAHDPRALQALSGTDIWKSTDGGVTWTWVAAPFNESAANPGAGGEDTDIAVATAKNSNGFYNIYAASLWIGSTNVAVSEDGGQTWNVTPVNGEPVQDRPWLSADGACLFYLSYHAIAPYDTVVDKYDACNAQDQAVGSAVDPTETSLFAGNIEPNGSNRFGKQTVDTSPTSPFQHRVYVPMSGCATPTSNGLPEEGVGCAAPSAEIFVGYSDNGVTYTDSVVAPIATGKLLIWPATITTDVAGNVYVAWFDDQHSYLSVSKDGGVSWSTPVQVNAAPALSSVYPTVAAATSGPAATAGTVDVAFYGSTTPGDADAPTAMGAPNTTPSASWQLFLATSRDFGKTWTQTTVTPTIHTGVLCYNGSGCGVYAGDRNLLDDFGLALSPVTGNPVMAFTNDQPGGVAGLTHTDFAALLPPSTSTPEQPVPAAGVVLVALVGILGLRRRRRGSTG